MVSNLLARSCGNHDAQPIVKHGKSLLKMVEAKKADPPSTLNKVNGCTHIMGRDDFRSAEAAHEKRRLHKPGQGHGMHDRLKHQI